MKRQIRLILITAILLLALANVVSAQEDVVYVFNGTELQRIENGVVTDAWLMPNTLETQQIRAALEAREHFGDAADQYGFTFDADRMYVLREGQVVGLWALRGSRWVEQPVLNVQYQRRNEEIQRIVNGEVQQVWPMLGGLEAQQLMVSMQAQANKQVALHMFTELYIDHQIEHMPQLVDTDFRLHYIPIDKTADWSWYRPEFEALTTSPTADPVLMAVDDLVVTQHPTDMHLASMLRIPPLETEDNAVLFDIYRIRDGQVTDLWMGYDLTALTTE